MKKLILLFVFSLSMTMKAQTFIGKTKDEVTKLNVGNKLTATEKDSLLADLIFTDSKLPLQYRYSFDKGNFCVVYMISTSDKKTAKFVRKDIEKKAFEKISDKSWVQKVDGNIYGWHEQGFGEHVSFVTTKIDQ